MKELYNEIFRRKSFRNETGLKLSQSEMIEAEQKITELRKLDDNIKTKIKIIKSSLTTANRGEICIEFFSEKKDGYLLNAGYMLQQLELFLCSKNIGSCWMGMAKPDSDTCDGLDYVIMLACSKAEDGSFRKSVDDFNRKSTDEICEGSVDGKVVEAVRLAPSACNTQCWHIKGENGRIVFFRDTRIESCIPPQKLAFFNTIDMGIALCHAEAALENENCNFRRTVMSQPDGDGLIKIAEYDLQ